MCINFFCALVTTSKIHVSTTVNTARSQKKKFMVQGSMNDHHRSTFMKRYVCTECELWYLSCICTTHLMLISPLRGKSCTYTFLVKQIVERLHHAKMQNLLNFLQRPIFDSSNLSRECDNDFLETSQDEKKEARRLDLIGPVR